MFISTDLQGLPLWRSLSVGFNTAENAMGGSTESYDDDSQGSEEYSDLAAGVLQGMPIDQRSVFEPYVKQWDSQVQKRFQDLHNEYKPYKELGWDTETLQQVAEVYRVLNEEPERLYQALHEEFGGLGETQEDSELEESDPDFQGLPPEVVSRLDQTEDVLRQLAQYVIQQETTKQESQEDSELEDYLSLLTEQYGEFDEEYVVTKIANGMDGEAAIQSWQNMIEKYMGQAESVHQGLPPASLSSVGGGAVPSGERQSLGSIPSKDIQSLVANIIAQSNNS